MAKKQATIKTVEALKHDEATRKNIPTAEYQSVMQKNEQDPVRVPYERRNRDLDPQLVWRGKDEQDWSDLIDDRRGSLLGNLEFLCKMRNDRRSSHGFLAILGLLHQAVQSHLDFAPPFSYNPIRSCEPVFLPLSINP